MDLMLTVFFISLIIVATGATYRKMQDFYLTEPLLALALGVLLGPDGVKLIGSSDTAHEFEVLKRACEFTIAMALMATALRLPHKFFRENMRSQSIIVLFAMILMWLCSAAILYWLLVSFSIVQCLLLGAIITPTDPVVASTIVTGEKAKKFLPASIRNTLSFEAGSNDGLAYPIVLFAVFLLNSSDFPWHKWLTHTVLYETILCGIIAYLVGWGGGKVMHRANKAGFMNSKSLLPFSLALAFLLLAGLEVLKMNGIIGVFVGGLGFARAINLNEDLQEERVQESMERIFTIPVFFIFGLMLPWEDWYSMGWTAVFIAVFILLLRRIPAFLAVVPLIPEFKGKAHDAAIMGWFGPIGVAALYYAIHSKEKTGFDEAWVIPSLVVFASTIIHGISSVPVEKAYHNHTSNPDSSK